MEKYWENIEKTIGGLKFAVILILLFSAAMTVGTFLESYHGAEFANRVVYKTLPFMGLQFFMFLSILFAVFRRLPPKKRLYGFYCIHAGLIIIGSGAFMTYYSGIDGNINLVPNDPNRYVILNEDMVQVTFHPTESGFDGKRVTKHLPNTAFATNINESYEGIRFKSYLPYSEKVFRWKPEQQNYKLKSNQESNSDSNQEQLRHSSEYLLYNAQVSQSFRLSLHPEANPQDIQSNLQLGPLNILYFPALMYDCFTQSSKHNPSGLFFWDGKTQTCFTPESKQIPINKTKEGKRFLAFRHEAEVLSFFPDFSPWPLNTDFAPQVGSELRVFSKQLFQERPILFLFGKNLAYYNKDQQQWEGKSLTENKTIELPWMGFQIQLLEHKETEVPSFTPQYTKPIQQKGSIIKGQMKALELEIDGKNYWVTDETPLQLNHRGRNLSVHLIKDYVSLPFELVLTQFKMDKDPGTNNPASYESFVRVFSNHGPSQHHIYMNNPLKYQGFTFYQASYSPLSDGSYSSTLSVNVDPGRPFKYLGSLLLVLGSVWHFSLNRGRSKNQISKTRNINESEVNA